MIALLAGVLESKDAERAVLNCSGVGYEVMVPQTTARTLPDVGAQVRLLTQLVVREDSMTLFGFATEPERAAFRLLLSVSGVGPRTALAILSGISAAELAAAIRQGSPAPFLRISGVGKKIAERVLLELKDKVALLPTGVAAISAAAPSEIGVGDAVRDAVEALLSLGIPSPSAKLAVGRAQAALNGKSDVETLVREALKYV